MTITPGLTSTRAGSAETCALYPTRARPWTIQPLAVLARTTRPLIARESRSINFLLWSADYRAGLVPQRVCEHLRGSGWQIMVRARHIVNSPGVDVPSQPQIQQRTSPPY